MSYQQKKSEVWEKVQTVADHSNPQSKGGTDHLNNSQTLNTTANRQKGNKKI